MGLAEVSPSGKRVMDRHHSSFPHFQPHSLTGLGGGYPALPSQHQGQLGPRAPVCKAARSAQCIRTGWGAWGPEVSRNQRDPGLHPGAPLSPCPQCPEGLACTLCPAHLASAFIFYAPVSPLPKPGPLPVLWPLSRYVCVRGRWEVSEPDLVRRVWRRKTWLEVTLGKGEKMRKGLPGAFDSKDPSPAPSSQHLLFPPLFPPL